MSERNWRTPPSKASIMRVTCTNCGQDHPTWDCRAAKKSTATGKGRLTRVGSQEADRSGSRPGLVEARLPQHATGKPQAGTQALPVDTNPVQDAKAVKVNMVATIATEPAQEAQILRPGPKFDKKAYMRAYMAEYRKGERRRGTLTNPPPSPKPHEGKGR